MSRRTLLPYLIVVLGLASAVNAQWYEPGHSYFEPLVEFEEFDVLATGYFSSYERAFWTEHTERPTLGSPTAAARHVEIWGPGGTASAASNALAAAQSGLIIPAIPSANPIPLPEQQSGLRELFPDFDIDQGNRFIFGHRGGKSGWEVSVLTPFEMTRDQVYGHGYVGQDVTTGGIAVTPGGASIIDGNGVELPDGLDDGFLPDSQTRLASPIGSVMILFDYEPGLMHGFLDLQVIPSPATPPGNVLADDANGDGILDGDGIADDINGNTITGPDGPIAGLIDFGDLVELPTSFHLVHARSIIKSSSIQLMRTKYLHPPRNGRTGVEMLYGFRYMNFDDHFFVRGEGGVLGRSFWNTEINNRLMGPQFGCRWTKNHGRWGLVADARALVAVNVQNWEQDASIGEDLIPSQHNHPLYFSPTVSHHGKRKYDFSPMGELRLNSNYQLSKGVTLNFGYNGLFAYGVRRAATHVHYSLPNMGFVEGKRESIVMSGINLGVTFRH